MAKQRPAVVIGAGPGIGASMGHRFAREGLPVALISRTAAPFAADVADEDSLRAALDAVTDALGVPQVVVYNAAVIRRDRVGELSLASHEAAWAVNVGGAIVAAARTLPAMVEEGGGSFLVTGGMPAPDPRYVSLSLGKAGVRTLVELLALQYERQGVHVATVTVTGAVAPGTAFDPDLIAEHYWRLHTQPPGQWQREIVYP
jgi:NAD(P)-dependent dehydrogenase (short-subunit alcohol dehydrogenase family)